jgi:hypothetical protein
MNLRRDKEFEPNRFDEYYEKMYGPREPEPSGTENEFDEFEGRVFETENAKFAGSNSLSSLSAKLVEIAGSANVNGSINAKTLRASGSLKVGGNLIAEEIEASGSIEVAGSVKCVDAKFSGSCYVNTGFWAKEKLVFKGTAKSLFIRCKGETWISGHLLVERVNSERVAIKGGGETKDIFCKVCSINTAMNGSSGFTIYLGPRGYNRAFKAGRVVATEELSVNRCEANVVAGGIVWVGNKCKIGRVFYTKNCQVEDKAQLDAAPVKLDKINEDTGRA